MSMSPNEVDEMVETATRILREVSTLDRDALSPDARKNLLELARLCKLSIQAGVELERRNDARGRLFDALFQPGRN